MARRRFRTDESGGSLVEFALIMPVFFGLLISILEVGLLGMVSSSFDNALVVSSRRIRTGQADKPTDLATFRTLICTRMPFGDCSKRLTLSVKSFGASTFGAAAGGYVDAVPQPGQTRPDPADDGFSVGGPDQIVLVTARYQWPLLTPFIGDAFWRLASGDVVITRRLLFKNEPYQ